MLRRFIKTKILCGLLCIAACCHQSQAKEGLDHSQNVVNTTQTAAKPATKINEVKLRDVKSETTQTASQNTTQKAPVTSKTEKTPESTDRCGDFSRMVGGFFNILFGSVFLCVAGCKIAEKLNEEKPLELFPDPLDKWPTPVEKKTSITVPPSAARTAVEQQITVNTPEERNKLISKINAFQIMEDIKKKRTELRKAMASAKKANDDQKIDEIKAQRKELTKRQRMARLQAAGPDLMEIREKRRLLTKQMTIARRRKNTESMDEITSLRAALKAEERCINASVKAFDYRAAVMAIKAQEYQRAA